ncbi:MAG: hypothetical protein QM451_11995 [Bacillota bacterium]|mgnify:CR=1 FL=1|nr:hypothetical protein [Bacillota bacterium]HHT90575.1 hypothetical protein [Bacillota bacterium]
MSYRDHLEAQKKYIRTKKEALEAKKDRQQHPRPPRLDPPPAPVKPWLVALIAILLLLPLFTVLFILPRTMVPAQSSHDGLVIWIYGTESEYLDVKNWLEPEILANDLQWTIAHATDRYALVDMLRSGYGDLLIIDQEFAEELHRGQALVPLLDKLHWPTWDDCFVPFWEIQPFRKTFGWALPVTGNIDQARHLFIVMQQFAPPFTPELPPQQSL